MSLHVMDLAENSIRAGATVVEVRVREDRPGDRLTLEIEDDGEGMDRETMDASLDPFFTTKIGKRTGLGLPLLSQASREAGGEMKMVSEKGRGTLISAEFVLSHPDRKPLGDMQKTVRLLGYAHPEVDFRFNYTVVTDQGDLQ